MQTSSFFCCYRQEASMAPLSLSSRTAELWHMAQGLIIAGHLYSLLQFFVVCCGFAFIYKLSMLAGEKHCQWMKGGWSELVLSMKQNFQKCYLFRGFQCKKTRTGHSSSVSNESNYHRVMDSSMH